MSLQAEQRDERLLWRISVQRAQRRRVHGLGHHGDLLLRVAVDRFALREELPDLLVDVLDRRLLVALVGVAEKQVGPLLARLGGELDSLDVREARVPVGQDRREDLAELLMAERFLQALERGRRLGRVPLLYREQEDEVYLRED